MKSFIFPTWTILSLALLQLTESIAQAAPAPNEFYLKTKVVNPKGHKDTGSNKNNLWVYSYHTGAGQGDAMLSANKTYAWPAYLNDTRLLFNSTIGPWPMGIEYGPYQEWNTVTISIASELDTPGFFFNGSGLQNNESVAGWLACDWWHGAPQLFNLNEYEKYKLPNSCSKINLLPVAV